MAIAATRSAYAEHPTSLVIAAVIRVDALVGGDCVPAAAVGRLVEIG